ncbi:MAG: hypothetical protein HYX55_07355 [Chloroflexi bacterium]|nr:hypothetical protein [Chloroflexota bacterium]
MTLLRRITLVPAIAAIALLAAPTSALASCVAPLPLDAAFSSADIVFVGTVTGTSNRDTWANVAVEEIWKGPDQARSIVIQGGPAGNAATSVDREFKVGAKYLFFPYVSEGALHDNNCTPTMPWTDDLLKLRPVDAHAPFGAVEGEAGSPFGGLLAPLAVAVLVAAVLLLVGLAARSRQAG